MTSYIDNNKIAQNFFDEAKRTATALKKLLRIIAVLLLIAAVISIFMTVSRNLKICYRISENLITLKTGDTVWDIAENNIGEYPLGIRSYVAEICRINDILNVDCVFAGEKIIVPIYTYKFS